MRPLDAVRIALCLVTVVTLGACGTGGGNKVDYKSAIQLPPLDVPPDLSRPGGSDDRYIVPDVNSKGATTFSEYNRDRATQRAGSGAVGVLPQQDNARIVRDGSQRWLVVKGSPDQVWPVVKDFWQENGLIVNIELPEAGVMETDWAEKRAKVDAGTIRNFLSRVLDMVYSNSERDKYRTRFEHGAQPGTTEIYISHRGMEEVYTGTASVEDIAKTRWQPRPPDPELEAEMLGRLMVRFGVGASQAKALVASPTVIPLRAKLASGPDGASLLALDEQFDRAWRRVGLALDRVGFTVEDRDRTKGLYFVRYIDPEGKGADDKGFFSWLKFWGSDDKAKPGQQFSIEVKDTAQGCQVKVLGKDGAQESTQTAGRILTLLYDQLK